MLTWVAQHWIAVLLLGGYTLFLLINAVRGRAQTDTMADYYVGGRRLSGWVVGVSFCATYASTNSYVGNAGKGYALGAPWLLFPLFMVLFTWLSWTSVAPRLREFSASLDALTLPDFLRRRYASRRVGQAAALLVLFASVLYLVAIFKGAGNVLQLFLNVDYEVAVLLTLIVVVFYTAVGGFLSVARTDVAQGLIMLLGSLLVGYFVFSRALELTDFSTLTSDVRLAPLFDWNAGVPLAVLVGILLSGSLKLLVDPRQVSRFFALEDQRALRRGMWVALILLLLIQLGLFPVGLLAHLFFDAVEDTDMIMPMLLQRADVFPVWASDVLLVAIVSAAMSSMDSVLLVAASVLVRDLWSGSAGRSGAGDEPSESSAPDQRELQSLQADSEQRGIRRTRVAVVGLAALAAVIALRPPGDIVGITIFSGSLYAACFLPALWGALHWRSGHALAALGSMLAGVLVLLVWIGLGLDAVLHEVFAALAGSSLVFIGLSLGVAQPLPPAAELLVATRGAALESGAADV